jgi:hypothetical protein
MTRPVRSLTIIPIAVFFQVSAATLITLDAAPPSDGARITAAANVTLRDAPSPQAPAVAQIPLGTEVADASPDGLDKTWIRIRLADGREGWVIANLTWPLDKFWRWPTFDRIIVDRLSRTGDGFPAAIELVSFIDRVSVEYTDPDGRARIDLSRLRALSAALSAVPAGARGRREPYTSWLASQKSSVIYDEPAARWMLADEPIWELHTRHMSTPTADEIAWFAVSNGLSGECEGSLTCYLTSRNRLQGEYLRRQPDGRHAADAVLALKKTAELVAAPATPQRAYAFTRPQDCRAFTSSLDALTAAVQATRVEARNDTLASFATLRRICQ